MKRKFTANGSFIPQDVSGNDMCILFMKYGRCRFKAKCKKSHWVPPLPSIHSSVVLLQQNCKKQTPLLRRDE